TASGGSLAGSGEDGGSARPAASGRTLFSTPTRHYDILIELRAEAQSQPLVSQLPGKRKREDGEVELTGTSGGRWVPKKLLSRGARTARQALLVGFDPLRHLLAELEERFGELAVFFVDTLGGSVIGVVLKPKAFLPAAGVHLPTSHHTMPATMRGAEKKDAAAKLLPNMFTMVREIAIMGEGLVKDVRLNMTQA
ncbi:hypothetical protein CYMTET_14952, partial [Cymbomonas tetramitiformis]